MAHPPRQPGVAVADGKIAVRVGVLLGDTVAVALGVRIGLAVALGVRIGLAVVVGLAVRSGVAVAVGQLADQRRLYGCPALAPPVPTAQISLAVIAATPSSSVSL